MRNPGSQNENGVCFFPGRRKFGERKKAEDMGSVIVDARDQRFVLFEMLDVEALCRESLDADFSRATFDMALNEAERIATEALFPALAEGDREGCRLENGNVFVPACYHRCMRLYREGGWGTMSVSSAAGVQGFPHAVSLAAKEWFIHNFGFMCYPYLMLMGKVVMAWLLMWEAGVTRGKLDAICAGKGIDPANVRECNALAKEDAEAAFYTGKTAAARYFV